ncbi:MAG TPA: 50S ribosomal protein L22 [Candidatus Nanoarchaeia archaeon]|nr:50S ribosomal protein L22 [Candidatus Nanoarchaeia archaeon]
MKTNQLTATEHSAKAKSSDISVSFKHSVEISRAIRYKNTAAAKKILQDTIEMKRAIPFRKYKQNVAHKRTMAAGRYPEKAARAFLRLINSVEANAQSKGLNTANLKITVMMANLASIPVTGKRFRTSTKRANLEIEVKEIAVKKAAAGKGSVTADAVDAVKGRIGKSILGKENKMPTPKDSEERPKNLEEKFKTEQETEK